MNNALYSIFQDDNESSEDKKSSVCGIPVPAEFSEAFRQMMDFELLKNPVFLMFAVSNFFTSIGFNMPFMYLPDRAILSGIVIKSFSLFYAFLFFCQVKKIL